MTHVDVLVDQHSAKLYRFCRGLTYAKEDAEDLFQETWIVALKKPEKLQQAQNTQGFLCKVAVNLWKSKQRKYARRKRIAAIEPLGLELGSGENIEAHFLQEEARTQMQALVAALPDRLRVPTLLYYTLEMDVAAIADTLQISPGTVKSRLFYARKEVKKGWEGYAG